MEGCSLDRGTACEEIVVGSTAALCFSLCSQVSLRGQLTWPRLVCELLCWSEVSMWAGEGRLEAVKGEHQRQPDHRGSGGLWLSVKGEVMTRWEALTEAGAREVGIAGTGQFH